MALTVVQRSCLPRFAIAPAWKWRTRRAFARARRCARVGRALSIVQELDVRPVPGRGVETIDRCVTHGFAAIARICRIRAAVDRITARA
jgi:hypothetical protein